MNSHDALIENTSDLCPCETCRSFAAFMANADKLSQMERMAYAAAAYTLTH